MVTVGMWVAGLWCVAALAVVAAGLLGGAEARFTVNGAPVSRAAFYRHPVFSVFIAAMVYSGAVAVAIHREHPSARLLMVAVWPVSLLGSYLVPVPDMDAVERAMAAVPFVAMSAFATWYLFVKVNVSAYFDERSAWRMDAKDDA